MKACGLVVEYNPFHLGHKYHLEKAKTLSRAEVTIAVMSGNFVQRGEPAIFGKDIRVKTALDNEVDLVVELPFIYGVEAADIFAKYSLFILEALKCETVVFGSETGSIEDLNEKYHADSIPTPRLDEVIQENLAKGLGYPKARALAQKAIHNYYLETPNDILATSYINAIKRYNLNIKPLSFKICKKYKNAAKIRKMILNNKDISKLVSNKYSFKYISNLDKYFDILKYKLLTTSSSELASIHLVDEGIENLFIKQIKLTSNMAEFIAACVSKRYSGARIKRTIIHILNNTDKQEAERILNAGIPYVRVLGFNEVGQKYLNSISKECQVPILSKFGGRDLELAQLEKRASDVYYSVFKEPSRSKFQRYEITKFPIRKISTKKK